MLGICRLAIEVWTPKGHPQNLVILVYAKIHGDNVSPVCREDRCRRPTHLLRSCTHPVQVVDARRRPWDDILVNCFNYPVHPCGAHFCSSSLSSSSVIRVSDRWHTHTGDEFWNQFNLLFWRIICHLIGVYWWDVLLRVFTNLNGGCATLQTDFGIFRRMYGCFGDRNCCCRPCNPNFEGELFRTLALILHTFRALLDHVDHRPCNGCIPYPCNAYGGHLCALQ